jgi:hypothetical protein
MRVNIWIRKENEEKWNNVPDKSNWINTILSNSDDTSRYGKERPSPAGPIVEVLSEVLPEIKLCKHGSDPKFCKFSKPGKPCK